jgi:hypothetical protein
VVLPSQSALRSLSPFLSLETLPEAAAYSLASLTVHAICLVRLFFGGRSGVVVPASLSQVLPNRGKPLSIYEFEFVFVDCFNLQRIASGFD